MAAALPTLTGPLAALLRQRVVIVGMTDEPDLNGRGGVITGPVNTRRCLPRAHRA